MKMHLKIPSYFGENIIMVPRIKSLLYSYIHGCLPPGGHPHSLSDRNLMARFSKEEVVRALIPQAQWKPYPKTVAEWRAAVPVESIRAADRRRGKSI